MAASSGRDFTISKAGTVLAGLRENSVSFDGSPVDITGKSSNGFRTLASFSGVRSFEITASGFLDDIVLQAIAADEDSTLLLTDITIEYADGATCSGDVFLSSYQQSAPHETEVTYSVTLQSSGEWSYTPAV